MSARCTAALWVRVTELIQVSDILQSTAVQQKPMQNAKPALLFEPGCQLPLIEFNRGATLLLGGRGWPSGRVWGCGGVSGVAKFKC